MKTLKILSAAAALLLAVSVQAHSQGDTSTANIATRGLTESDFPRWQEIEPGIYAYEDLHSPDGAGNVINTVSLIITTSDGVVVADGQQTVEQSQLLIDNVKKFTDQPIKYVVIASDHIDHVGGNEAFKAAYPDVVFISSYASQRVLADKPNPPTETVASKRVINMGDTEIQVLNIGRGHTGGDLVVYLPQSKVLFMGELYLRRVFPAMRTGNPSEWVQAIKNAQGMDVSWYIPGHGFVDDAATLEKELNDARLALEHVIAEVKRLHAAGVPCDMAKEGAAPDATCEAAKQADWGPYADWALRSSLEPFAVVKVYQEIEGQLH